MTANNKIILAMRSGAFFLGLVIIILFLSVSGILFTWFLPFHIRGRYFVSGNAVIVWWLKICCGISTHIIGTLPSKHGYVALAKHQSQWETFFLQWYLFPVATVVKKELLSIPFFGWSLRMVNAIGIDRSNPRAAMRQTMERGLEQLQNNHNLLIFPEGTRVLPGQRGNYARGGAGIAIAAGAPIIAIAHNAGNCWPAKSWILKPGVVTLALSEPIDTADRNSKDVIKEVEAWIEGQCAAMS